MRSWHIASRAWAASHDDDWRTIVATATAFSCCHHRCGRQHVAACVFGMAGSHRLILMMVMIVMASCRWLMLVHGRARCMMTSR